MGFDQIWNKIHENKEWGKYPSEEVIRFVARNYYNTKRNECRILDFGCGTGNIAWYLAREGFDAYGFDGSKVAVDKAVKRIKEEGLCANLSVQDGSSTTYESDSFDAIIDSGCIEANATEGIILLLNEAYRLLKNKGKIFSTALFNSNTTGYGTGEKIDERTFRVGEGPVANGGQDHFFTEGEIVDLWGKAGFKNIRIDTLERTDYNRKYKVSYFMVEAQKL